MDNSDRRRLSVSLVDVAGGKANGATLPGSFRTLGLLRRNWSNVRGVVTTWGAAPAGRAGAMNTSS